jgi:hypothetical protein
MNLAAIANANEMPDLGIVVAIERSVSSKVIEGNQRPKSFGIQKVNAFLFRSHGNRGGVVNDAKIAHLTGLTAGA